MNKIIKILIFIIVSFIVICQINKFSFGATSLEEWKEIIDYHEVAVDGPPASADVEIDIDTITTYLPKMQTTLPLVIYGKDSFEDLDPESDIGKAIDILDIDFMNNESDNLNESWKNIRKYVKMGFSATLYVSAAALIIQLIYIGIILIKHAISESSSIQLPYEKKLLQNKEMLAEGNKIDRDKVRKELTEQWIITIVAMFFIIVYMSLVVSFSKVIVQNDDAERELYYLTVYVKDNSGTGTNDRGYYFNTNPEALFLFQSKRSFTKYGLQNILFLAQGLLSIIGKFFVYLILLVRMLLIAVITVISPILVLINGFKKIHGDEGFLKKLIFLYAILVFIRPGLMILGSWIA